MRPRLAINEGTCSEPGCDRPCHCRGVCARHYRRIHYRERERGRRGHTPARVFVAGDTSMDKTGYVRQKLDDGGWELQHRIVMEGILGRPVRDEETVHHRNGVRHDNSPGNLELWASVHPKGQRVSDLLAFAHEIIERYGA